MIAENGLSLITVEKSGLLTALRKNAEQHKVEFVSAHAGYTAAVVKELESMLDDAKTGKAYRKVVNLVEPQDHSKDYVRVIRMLDMSVETQIKITENEFNNYVLDEWSWQNQFKAVSSTYNGR